MPDGWLSRKEGKRMSKKKQFSSFDDLGKAFGFKPEKKKENKVAYSKNASKRKNNYNQYNNKDYSDVKAVAPYNFIPLNDEVVYSQWEWKTIPGFERYYQDKLSGEIELRIETVTPLYIR